MLSGYGQRSYRNLPDDNGARSGDSTLKITERDHIDEPQPDEQPARLDNTVNVHLKFVAQS